MQEIKEKAKSKRKNIEFLRNLMIDDFFNNDDSFKITNMMSCGYEDYAWAIEFEGYEKVVKYFFLSPLQMNVLTISPASHLINNFTIMASVLISKEIAFCLCICKICIYKNVFVHHRKTLFKNSTIIVLPS